MNNKKGFTMIELIVVMAIIAVLIGLGVEGLIRFKSLVEIQESGRQTISLMTLMKNSAKNDVRNPNGNINFRGYKLVFNPSNARFVYGCESTSILSNTSWTCTYDERLANVLLPNELPLKTESTLVGSVPQCISVYFESLTGDILIETVSTNSQPIQGKCFISFVDANNRYKSYLYIDAIEDTFLVFNTSQEVETEFRKLQ